MARSRHSAVRNAGRFTETLAKEGRSPSPSMRDGRPGASRPVHRKVDALRLPRVGALDACPQVPAITPVDHALREIAVQILEHGLRPVETHEGEGVRRLAGGMR